MGIKSYLSALGRIAEPTYDNFTRITNQFIVASGGNEVVDSAGYKIHVFTGPGTFTVGAVNPIYNTIEYVVVAGGGGGGVDWYTANLNGRSSGGGGAGGFRTGIGLTVTAGSYTVSVGGGGAGGISGSANPAPRGGNGNPSYILGPGISSITSAGGGGGAGHDNAGNIAANPGGSGGGSTHDNTNGPRGLGNQPPVSPSQGSDGGTSANTVGGAGSPITWVPASYGTPGPAPGRYFAGGGGASTSPNPFAGGGGGGASQTGQPGLTRAGGVGGGGPGGTASGATAGAGTPGTTNTGGGGGGSRNTTGGSGGSGIVIIRYPIQ